MLPTFLIERRSIENGWQHYDRYYDARIAATRFLRACDLPVDPLDVVADLYNNCIVEGVCPIDGAPMRVRKVV